MRTRWSAAATQAARLGIRSCTGLEAADGDDLILGANSDGEGAVSAVQNGVEAVVERLERWDNASKTDPDKGSREELGWQLAGQLDARIVPRQGRSQNIPSFRKNFIKESTEISSFCKNSLGNTIGAPKTASAREDQCLPSVVRKVRGVQKVTPQTMSLRRP